MKDKVKKIIAEQFSISENEIGDTDSLREKLHADSLDLIELLLTLENEFDLYIADNEAVGIDTINDIVAKLEEKKA